MWYTRINSERGYFKKIKKKSNFSQKSVEIPPSCAKETNGGSQFVN